jgi:hypothetical protein
MNDLELAEYVDELERDFRQDPNPAARVEVVDGNVDERDAALATEELARRGLPITVRSIDSLSDADRIDWFGQ